jgi:hypothetical protein
MKQTENKTCPECGGSANNPSVYWLSEEPTSQEQYCSNKFHDVQERLFAKLKEGF